MRLTVIGCAGSYPSAESPASCYLIEHDGHRILLDMGNGSLGTLQRFIAIDEPDALDAIILSHCHVDHCVDATSLFVQRNYHPTRSFAPLPLLGPSDTADRLVAIYGMRDPAMLLSVFEPRGLEPGPTAIGPFEITTAPAAHPVEAYSVRVTAGGRSITYSGDTGPNPALAGLARGTDIALFEASFVGCDNPAALHLTGADAGRIARESGAGMLLLTHLVGWLDEADVVAEAAAEFPGAIEVARSGMVVTL